MSTTFPNREIASIDVSDPSLYVEDRWQQTFAPKWAMMPSPVY